MSLAKLYEETNTDPVDPSFMVTLTLLTVSINILIQTSVGIRMCYNVAMVQTTHIRGRSFSYAEFREATGLSKKEADNWVQAGVIRAEPANGHRRRYRFESIFDGIIARQLADFSSRELLGNMMHSLHRFLIQEGINLADILPNPAGQRELVQIYTRKSAEVMAGGGVRGVVSYVRRHSPRPNEIGRAVFLVVDLTLIALEAQSAIGDLPPA
jgi:hypothetical protein